jgi:parallel beta-helix repeat protein
MDETIYSAKQYNRGISQDSLWATEFIKIPMAYDYILDLPDSLAILPNISSVTAINSVTEKSIEASKTKSIKRIGRDVFTTHPWTIVSDDKNETIILGAGEHHIKSDLIIDKSSSLTIKPGAILKMSEGQSIYVFGKLDINGTDENPVIIEPAVTDKPWGVFAIQGHYNPGYVHTIDGAIISGGGVPQTFDNAIYTGMLSAYNADLTITNSTIRGNVVGDDGFNAKQCKVTIDHCIFENAFSDAIDLDYAKGSIVNCYFENNGNDAIDLMTSTINIENNYIFGSGDKGISIGERSNPFIVNNVILRCVIGMEIKDLSDPQIKNNVILACDTGVNVYHKNDRYEKGGRGTIASSIIADSALKAVMVDNDSKLKVKDSIFDQKVISSKDLTLENCVHVTVNLDNDYMWREGDIGLKKPIEMWWKQ